MGGTHGDCGDGPGDGGAIRAAMASFYVCLSTEQEISVIVEALDVRLD